MPGPATRHSQLHPLCCRLLVRLGGSSLSLLVIATPQPEDGGNQEDHHQDVLQELTVSWTDSNQTAHASIVGMTLHVVLASARIRVAEANFHMYVHAGLCYSAQNAYSSRLHHCCMLPQLNVHGIIHEALSNGEHIYCRAIQDHVHLPEGLSNSMTQPHVCDLQRHSGFPVM